MKAVAIGILTILLGTATPAPAAEDIRPAGLAERQRAWLSVFAGRQLDPGPPRTWVDDERWSAAHARLSAGTQTDQANAYFKSVQPVSTRDGLVADTDVQATDLLRTWFEFHDKPALEPDARTRLEQFFRDWTVPNRDRNRDADTRYEWPCEYTENHSLHILTAAYLIDTALGRDRELRRSLLRRFLHDRARYGWSEFHSPGYMPVTAKALTALYDFAPDAEIAQAARMLLDLLMIEYSAECLNEWRGVPFARGYGSQADNSRSQSIHLARLWFGLGPDDAAFAAAPFTAHMLTSRYAPPPAAVAWATDLKTRGSYTMRTTGTTGPGRRLVPMIMWVSPAATLASAQGWGSYYDGCYWSASFADSPRNVITGLYGRGRNLLQLDNVLIVFGSMEWRGGLKPEKEGAYTTGESADAVVGQIDLEGDAHVLRIDTKTTTPGRTAMRAALERMGATWSNGTIRVTLPDGRAAVMENERIGEGWRMVRAELAGEPVRIEHPWLIDAPGIRSERGSGLFRIVHGGKTAEYDLRDPMKPTIRMSAQARLPAPPPWAWEGPAGMGFVFIPPGEFPMGSPLTEGRENERPQRWVQVDGFYMSRTEVTVGAYRQFLAETPDAPPPPDWYWKNWGKTDRHAMTYVSWAEARRFCEWLSKKSGRMCRLPTEAEWEKAAKGYSHRTYPWGSGFDGTQAGQKTGVYGEVAAHPLDTSPFGVLDMAGGVWEWCGDDFDRAPAGAAWKSLRGCGWNFDPDTFRCSLRSGLDPGARSVHIGFRVVAPPGSEQP